MHVSLKPMDLGGIIYLSAGAQLEKMVLQVFSQIDSRHCVLWCSFFSLLLECISKKGRWKRDDYPVFLGMVK